MKKFFTLIVAMVCAMVCATRANAEVVKPADIYRDYTFTCAVELNDAGKAEAGLAEALLTECDATIAKGEYYDVELTGLLGSEETQLGNKIDIAAKTININNPNASGWIVPSHNICIGLEDGTIKGFEMTYEIDTETGVITIPDFLLYKVTIDCFMGKEDPVLVGKVTGAKMTPKGGEPEPEVLADLSGEWKFVADPESAYATMPGSEWPATYTLVLESAGTDNSTYDATLKIEGYDDLVLPLASFDGKVLMIEFDNLAVAEGVYLADFSGGTQGAFSYQVTTDENIMNVYGPLCLHNGTAFVQWYYIGTVARGEIVEPHNFAGIYEVTVSHNSYIGIDDTDDLAKVGETFAFKIEMKADAMGVKVPCMTEWMGTDVWTLTMGDTECAAEVNTLSIPTGMPYHRTRIEDDGWTQIVELLADGSGSTDNPVTLTYDEVTDSYAISNFGMLRSTRKYTSYVDFTDEVDFQHSNWYYNCAIKKVDESAIADVKAKTERANAIFNLNGQRVSSPARGLYIVDGKKTIF
ncbi:MAG: hypothetical protein HUK01_05390 [Bacteroidaceae bacterium]|nr:hypothetical protein [Bacteroidaceae bacterium]